jgi:antitoxin ParD1/3/4
MAANPSITTINISLPEAMRAFVEAQVATGAYGSVSEYFRELLRREQRDVARDDLETKLLDALKTPTKDMTAADWKRLRGELAKRYRGGRS